ncbi:hypothetical protein CesoFtcFv8_021843 [Champsocephalus esox]|uniref:Uncharacterized protein n=1 Tax=Champsocephalus esox TaxID=159716 RepID=A0AAN8B9B2_9TELE|nr:hypothetical protein CesoFtcFv8_021843 [Champsocephalus esox]
MGFFSMAVLFVSRLSSCLRHLLLSSLLLFPDGRLCSSGRLLVRFQVGLFGLCCFTFRPLLDAFLRLTFSTFGF